MLQNITSCIAWEKMLDATVFLVNVNQINYFILLTIQEANGFAIFVGRYLPITENY